MKINNSFIKLTTISIIVIITSCRSDKPIFLDNVIGAFDIYGNNMAVTYFKNNIGSIYYYSLIDNSYQKLTYPTVGCDNLPTFSSDGKKIAYINYSATDFKKCCINILDLETKIIDTLLYDSQILDLCFSNNNEYIYFTKSEEITNYSPVARKAPHGIDVFEIDIANKKVKSITDIKEYAMQSIVNTYSDSLLAINIYSTNGTGICNVSIIDGTISRINMKNDPRPAVNMYYLPISIKQDSCLFEAPYEIYKYDFTKDKAEMILRSSSGHFQNIIVDKDWQNISFMNSDGIFNYNIKSKNLRTINIKLD